METTRICNKCGKEYSKPQGVRGKRWTERKYCTITCQRTATKQLGQKKKLTKAGKEALANNGRRNINKETPEQRMARMAKVIANRTDNWTPPRLGKRGAEVTGVWLDNEATYNAKHRWIQNNWSKTGKCQNCGRKPKPFGNRKYGTEWANLDKLYDRNDKETWQELCVRCHRALDRT